MIYRDWTITIVSRPELHYLNQVTCVCGSEMIEKKFTGEVDMDIVRDMIDGLLS